MLRIGIGLRIVDGGGGLGIDPAASAIFAAFTTPPVAARQELINRFVVSLKAAGVWSLLDVLYVFAAHDSQAALINWKNPGTFNGTANGTLTFTTDRGFTGDGSTGFIDTGFNPTTSGGNLTLNSAHIAVRVLTDFPNKNVIGQGGSASRISVETRRSTDNAFRGNLDDTTGWTFAGLASGIGHYIGNRSSSAARQGYINGISVGTDTVVSSALDNSDIFILDDPVGTGFSSQQVASCSFGASLSAAQANAISSADLAYMHGVGAA